MSSSHARPAWLPPASTSPVPALQSLVHITRRSKSDGTFKFYTLSEEDQDALRQNTPRCMALMRPCKPLADWLAATGGVLALLSLDDERLLQGFHLVAQAFGGHRYEGMFDRLRRQAELWHSDVGLRSGRVEALFAEHEPVALPSGGADRHRRQCMKRIRAHAIT